MFGIIAGVLIVLWLLGFLAFHVTSGLIHIVLVIGLILLVVHFVTGRSATVLRFGGLCNLCDTNVGGSLAATERHRWRSRSSGAPFQPQAKASVMKSCTAK